MVETGNLWPKPLECAYLRRSNSTQRISPKEIDSGTKVNVESFIIAKNGNNQVFDNRKIMNSIKELPGNGVLWSYWKGPLEDS